MNREFDEIGAHYNAFTSEENTVYYASVLPEYQEASIDILADIMRPSLREDDFDMEKKVILEEIQMYVDQPPFGMDDHIKELHFGKHPLARSVLGTSRHDRRLCRVDQMRAYFESRYSPGNVFVAAAGKVDFDALVKQVAARCGDWEPQAAPRDAAGAELQAGVRSRRTASRPRSSTCCNWPTAPPAKTPIATPRSCWPRSSATTRAAGCTGSSSIRASPRRASLGHYEYQGLGMFYTWLSCAPEDAAENFAQLARGLRDGRGEGRHRGRTAAGPQQGEGPRRARQRAAAQPAVQRRRQLDAAPRVPHAWPTTSATLDAVTLDDVHAVLKKYPLTRATTVTIGPLAELAPMTAGRCCQRFSPHCRNRAQPATTSGPGQRCVAAWPRQKRLLLP